MYRKSTGQLRPDHENPDLNKDLRYINLPPEEIPHRGRLSKYIDVLRKIRKMAPDTAFYFRVPKTENPKGVKYSIKSTLRHFDIPSVSIRFRYSRIYIKRPATASPAATAAKPAQPGGTSGSSEAS